MTRIAEELLRNERQVGKGSSTWTVASVDPKSPGSGVPTFANADASLYQGTAGIALFLAEHAKREGSTETAAAAARALRYAVDAVAGMTRPTFGFYAGAFGVAWTLVHVAELLGLEWPKDDALHILSRLVGSEADDRGLDVIAGAAGAIPALLDIASRLHMPEYTDSAFRLGEHLWKVKVIEARGISWGTPQFGLPRNLLGYAHGAVGVAVAMAELYSVTRDGRFLVATEEALEYERARYDSVRRNWPDYRDGELGTLRVRHSEGEFAELVRRGLVRTGDRLPTFMVAWCHGAAGGCLARTRLCELRAESMLREELVASREVVLQSLRGAGLSHSLCHGLCGNADVLLSVADAEQDEALRRQVGEMATEWCDAEMCGTAWRSGALAGAEDPSLMLGLAGIGHFLLRCLHNPMRSALLCRGMGAPMSEPSNAVSELEARHEVIRLRNPRQMELARRIVGDGVGGEGVCEVELALEGLQDEARAAGADGRDCEVMRHAAKEAQYLDREAARLLEEEDDVTRALLARSAQWTWEIVRTRKLRLGLAGGVRVHRVIFAWNEWAQDSAMVAPKPLPTEGTYVLMKNGFEVVGGNVQPLLAHLLRELCTPATPEECSATLAVLKPDGMTDGDFTSRITELARQAFERGLLEVTQAAAAPNDLVTRYEQ